MSQSPIQIAPAVAAALARGEPVVALETVVITHGLPPPTNVAAASAIDQALRDGGATPATVGVLAGRPTVGLTDAEVAWLAAEPRVMKASIRDLPFAVATGRSAGTTVAATAFLAERAGLRVFVTGGLGGVHHGAGDSFDVSADLPALALTPIVVVCAGAKSVLDLAATLEWLETAGVPVVGYGTHDFPGFFVAQTGLPLAARADTPAEVAAIFHAQRALGLRQALIVAVPPPADVALERAAVEAWHGEAMVELVRAGTRGKDVTPFLLAEIERRSGGASLRTNVALLRNNARVGATIARALAAPAG